MVITSNTEEEEEEEEEEEREEEESVVNPRDLAAEYCCCCLVAYRPSSMLVYFRDVSALKIDCTCCHTETEVADQTGYLTHWHRANQSHCWFCNVRHLTRQLLEYQWLSHWHDSTRKKIPGKSGNQTQVSCTKDQANKPVALGNADKDGSGRVYDWQSNGKTYKIWWQLFGPPCNVWLTIKW